MDEPRPPTMLALTSYLAAQVARVGRGRLARVLDPHDLRPPQFATLVALADVGPQAQHVLADRLGFNRSHLVGYLDVLEGRGLVGRERDPADRRRQRVGLTVAGRALADDLAARALDADGEVFAVLSDDERATLSVLLGRVLAAADAAGSPDGA